MNRRVTHTKAAAPIFNAKNLAAEFDHAVPRGIARLLLVCGPPAVPWAVVAVIVRISIKAVIRAWPQPHVREEVAEFVPSIADLDPAAAVVGVTVVHGIEAPLLHGVPCGVFGGLISGPIVTVDRGFASRFVVQAAAASRRSAL